MKVFTKTNRSKVAATLQGYRLYFDTLSDFCRFFALTSNVLLHRVSAQGFTCTVLNTIQCEVSFI